MKLLKSMKESAAKGAVGSVLLRNCSMDENVVPPNCPGPGGGGRKNTPFRKMLNALKKPKVSKFPPKVSEWRPRNKVKLSVSCQTSWSRMLWIEKGSWPRVV